MGRQGNTAGLWLGFGAASLAAVATGAAICAASGVPASLWGRNLAAWLAGGLLALGLAALGRRAATAILWATPVALAATFLGPGQAGVHRWVAAGPALMNMAMLVLPAAVVALAARATDGRWAFAPALAALLLLAAQPDASQATALAGAVALVALATTNGVRRALLVAGGAVIASAAWLRPDPLQPVPEVEDILELAALQSPVLAAAAVALLALIAAAPVLATRRSTTEAKLGGAALGIMLALWSATTAFGHFPVPLIGVGLSPILGAWLAVGLLAGLMRAPQGPQVQVPAKVRSAPSARW